MKKNTRTKVWWMKLAVSLVLSNVFFFLLFGADAPAVEKKLEPGLIEVQLSAQLLTPFQEGKRVLLIQRTSRVRLDGILREQTENGVIVSVNEETALQLITFDQWEVLPYLKDFRFKSIAQGAAYEIRY